MAENFSTKETTQDEELDILEGEELPQDSKDQRRKLTRSTPGSSDSTSGADGRFGSPGGASSSAESRRSSESATGAIPKLPPPAAYRDRTSDSFEFARVRMSKSCSPTSRRLHRSTPGSSDSTSGIDMKYESSEDASSSTDARSGESATGAISKLPTSEASPCITRDSASGDAEGILRASGSSPRRKRSHSMSSIGARIKSAAAAIKSSIVHHPFRRTEAASDGPTGDTTPLMLEGNESGDSVEAVEGEMKLSDIEAEEKMVVSHTPETSDVDDSMESVSGGRSTDIDVPQEVIETELSMETSSEASNLSDEKRKLLAGTKSETLSNKPWSLESTKSSLPSTATTSIDSLASLSADDSTDVDSYEEAQIQGRRRQRNRDSDEEDEVDQGVPVKRPALERRGGNDYDEGPSAQESLAAMEEHRESTDNECIDPPAREADEKIECDEALSGSDSAEKTDSSERGTGTEKSPIASESTSGIETKSEPEQTPSAESATTDVKASRPSHVEEGAGCAAETESPADTPAEKIKVGSEVSPPEKSKKRGSLVRGAMAIFKKSPHKKEASPTEKTGVLSRFRMTKSVSSPEKPREATVEENKEIEREAACATPEDEEAFKKGAEKKPVLKRLAKSISSVFKHKSGSGGETDGLVADQDEPERTPAEGSPGKAKDPILPEEGEDIKRIYWTKGRQSLTERPSLTTEMTDLPSTFTGVDVFKPGDSRRPSEAGENTSDEAVAGSLASSLGDIKEIASDKDEKSVSSTSADIEVESSMGGKTESKETETSASSVDKEQELKISTQESAEADVHKEPSSDKATDKNEDDKEAESKVSAEKTSQDDLEKEVPSESLVPDAGKVESEESTSDLKAATEPEQSCDVDKTD